MYFTSMTIACTNFPQLCLPQLSSSNPRLSPASSGTVLASNRMAIDSMQRSEDAKETIIKMFQKVEVSVSAYDTAWVAMAPSPASVHTPCFPGSIDWILENQLHDGSWGSPDRDPLLIKDALSSTLACVLALKRWNVGERQIRKGLDFIMSNFASVIDEEQISPVGFDVIFPNMLEEALKMDVNLHLASTEIFIVLRNKDLELKRIQEKNSKTENFHLAYIAEALGGSQNWVEVMKYQRKNGSLFNSPSTTAAAFTALQDSHCYSYLCSVLQQFGNAVPTLYPVDVYFRLYMVDVIEKFGIDRHFKDSISCVLDETFRQWDQGHEEIFSDFLTSVTAFRLLRHHGYDVSSEPLAVYHGEDSCFDRFGGSLEDIRAAVELFRASQLRLYAHESYLEKQLSQSRHFLQQQVSDHSRKADRFSKYMTQEVADCLKSPYHANLERLGSRKYIEHHDFDKKRVLKSSLCCGNFFNKDLLQLAKDDFSYCQSIHLQEIKQLQRWIVDTKLDRLTFSRQKLSYCYFSAAATLFSPELADARISWAKNGVLTTVVDDFFDVGSTEEEQLDLIQLVEEWGTNKLARSCSEKVQIIFSALQDTICEIGDKAHARQDHNVTTHIVEIWLSLIKSMWTESEMSRNKTPPTMEQYMANGYVSFALGPIVLPALYFIGPKLSQEVIGSTEYQNLFRLMSTCGRLLNDIQGFQREAEDGKLNAVSLQLFHGNGSISKEDVIRDIRQMVDKKRRELLKLVLRGDSGLVPRECRDVFWKMSKVVHLFYMKDDGFTSNELGGAVKAILHDPIEVR